MDLFYPACSPQRRVIPAATTATTIPATAPAEIQITKQTECFLQRELCSFSILLRLCAFTRSHRLSFLSFVGQTSATTLLQKDNAQICTSSSRQGRIIWSFPHIRGHANEWSSSSSTIHDFNLYYRLIAHTNNTQEDKGLLFFAHHTTHQVKQMVGDVLGCQYSLGPQAYLLLAFQFLVGLDGCPSSSRLCCQFPFLLLNFSLFLHLRDTTRRNLD